MFEATRRHRSAAQLPVVCGIALLCLGLSACGVEPEKTAAYAGGANAARSAGLSPATPRVAVDEIVLAEWPAQGPGAEPPAAPAPPAPGPPAAPVDEVPEAPAGEALEAPVGDPPAMIPSPPIPLPHYDVIAERANDRPDDMKTFYIVMDAVDPATDGFKDAVKHILRVVSSVNRGEDFSALVWDDILAAQTEAAYRSAPDMFTDVQLDAKSARNERHLIARYEGGVDSVGQPPAYVTSWFPHAGLFSPEIGMWVSSEVWRP